MILLKRLLTSAGIFIPLFIILYLGICMVGGGIQGAKIGVEHPNDPNAQALAQEAGINFVKNNLVTIVMTAFGVSSVVSLAISFSGILPWCKKPAEPSQITS